MHIVRLLLIPIILNCVIPLWAQKERVKGVGSVKVANLTLNNAVWIACEIARKNALEDLRKVVITSSISNAIKSFEFNQNEVDRCIELLVASQMKLVFESVSHSFQDKIHEIWVTSEYELDKKQFDKLMTEFSVKLENEHTLEHIKTLAAEYDKHNTLNSNKNGKDSLYLHDINKFKIEYEIKKIITGDSNRIFLNDKKIMDEVLSVDFYIAQLAKFLDRKYIYRPIISSIPKTDFSACKTNKDSIATISINWIPEKNQSLYYTYASLPKLRKSQSKDYLSAKLKNIDSQYFLFKLQKSNRRIIYNYPFDYKQKNTNVYLVLTDSNNVELMRRRIIHRKKIANTQKNISIVIISNAIEKKATFFRLEQKQVRNTPRYLQIIGYAALAYSGYSKYVSANYYAEYHKAITQSEMDRTYTKANLKHKQFLLSMSLSLALIATDFIIIKKSKYLTR